MDYKCHMNVTEMVVGFFGLFLVLFGVLFVFWGRNAERGYWSQRDTHGNPEKDSTPLGTIIARAGRYATGEYRAPIRITAIGVLLVYFGLGFFVLGILIWIL